MEPEPPQRSLIRANDAFYEALEKHQLDMMDNLWLHEGWVRCVHPGRDALRGWPAVRSSFEDIFAASTARWLHVTPTQIDVMVFGEIGVVACVENITTEIDDQMGMTVAQATNIFRLTDGGWRMMHHHASAAPMHVTQAFDGGVQ
jgi:ketosteroid isomerase-like protein